MNKTELQQALDCLYQALVHLGNAIKYGNKPDGSYMDDSNIQVMPPIQVPKELPAEHQTINLPTSMPTTPTNVHPEPSQGPISPKRSEAELVASAIAYVESGGKQVKGASGEFGTFQFLPSTWRACSSQYNQTVFRKNGPLPQTPENEWDCAVWKIGTLLKKYTPEEVALVWNTSLNGLEKPLRIKGVNKAGIPYDSQAYADKVVRKYTQLALEQQTKIA